MCVWWGQGEMRKERNCAFIEKKQSVMAIPPNMSPNDPTDEI
jgi:hypothetical protein